MFTIAPLLTEAERYLTERDLDRAAELYTQAHSLDQGRSPLPAIGLARIALALGRVAEARALLDRVLQRHPKSVEALTFRAVAADAGGDAAQALSFLQRAVALDAGYTPARYNLGRVLGRLGRWKEAQAALRVAVQSMPDIEVTYATVAVRAGDLAEATRVLAERVQAHPNDVDALVALADVLAEAGRLDLASTLLANASERLPKEAVLYARRAALALRLGQLDLARAMAARQLELDTENDEALLFAAALDVMQVDLEAAEKKVQRALAHDPSNWRAHHQLGVIYDALRLRRPALVAYRKAATLSPKAWEPRNNLALLLLDEKSPLAAREAKAVLEQALVVTPEKERAAVQYNLALAHWQLGEKGASERRAKEAAAGPTTLPVVKDARRFLKNFAAA